MVNVCVVGSIALDTLETAYGKREEVLGGSSTFIAIASSYLAPTGVVGIVGSDFPQTGHELLARLGVCTKGLEQAEGRTFRWSGKYRPDMIGRDTLSTELGVFESFNPKVPVDYQNAEFVVLGNIHPDLQINFLKQFTNPKVVVADTMKLWIDSAREQLGEVIKASHTFIVNDEEAREITDKVNLSQAADTLLVQGPKNVIIKRGEHGASLHNRQGVFYVPAIPVKEVKDPTGAGDSFLGGLVGYLARMGRVSDEILRQSVVVASAMASFTVEDFSVDRLIHLEKDELLQRCRLIQSMTSCAHVEL